MFYQSLLLVCSLSIVSLLFSSGGRGGGGYCRCVDVVMNASSCVFDHRTHFSIIIIYTML